MNFSKVLLTFSKEFWGWVKKKKKKKKMLQIKKQKQDKVTNSKMSQMEKYLLQTRSRQKPITILLELIKER